MPRLDRFHPAQQTPGAGFDDALREIRSGAKTGHWIWYVLPQIAGLGTSAMAREFALDGPGEAREYLRDATLRSRVLTITIAILDQLRAGRTLSALMGSAIDARKTVSSLTLFAPVAAALYRTDELDEYAAIARAADDVLTAAAAEGHPRCAHTTAALARAGL